MVKLSLSWKSARVPCSSAKCAWTTRSWMVITWVSRRCLLSARTMMHRDTWPVKTRANTRGETSRASGVRPARHSCHSTRFLFLISSSCRRLTGSLRVTSACLLFIKRVGVSRDESAARQATHVSTVWVVQHKTTNAVSACLPSPESRTNTRLPSRRSGCGGSGGGDPHRGASC